MNNNKSRRRFLLNIMLAGFGLSLPAIGMAQSPRIERPVSRQPNIVYILVDDMGYADLSSYGSQGYKTPAIDSLATEGIRFNQAYANAPICSPTRTALITGRYQGRFAAGLNEPNIKFAPGMELPLDTPTVASLLKRQGYRTAFVGKWHVAKVPEFSPLRYGYDTFFGISGGAADYFQHIAVNQKGKPDDGLHEDDKLVHRDGYLTDILADEAIRQIRVGGTKPLFLSLHFNAPHWPWEGPEDRQHSASLKDMRDRTGGSLETYAAMMVRMDLNVGRVLKALRDAGMDGNTIVVFTSDNGAERYSNTWPFVGYKGELLEGGIRVPLLIRWPGHIRAGTDTDQVSISMDMVPTFLAAAGGSALANLDGFNLLPQMLGQARPVARTLYWRMKANDQHAVREGDWKYLKIGQSEHLFNVADDPRERAEQKDSHSDVFIALRDKWANWNQQMLPYPADVYSETTTGTSYADRYFDEPDDSNDRENKSSDRNE